jgi:shikimate kinase
VVWLRGEFDAVYERAQRAGARPMLAGRGRDEVEALYRAREPYYRQADLTVDTTGINPDQVVAKLLLLLRYRNAATLSPLEKPGSLSPLGRGQGEG